MADDGKALRKIAVCSALFAGVAYAGYKIYQATLCSFDTNSWDTEEVIEMHVSSSAHRLIDATADSDGGVDAATSVVNTKITKPTSFRPSERKDVIRNGSPGKSFSPKHSSQGSYSVSETNSSLRESSLKSPETMNETLRLHENDSPDGAYDKNSLHDNSQLVMTTSPALSRKTYSSDKTTSNSPLTELAQNFLLTNGLGKYPPERSPVENGNDSCQFSPGNRENDTDVTTSRQNSLRKKKAQVFATNKAGERSSSSGSFHSAKSFVEDSPKKEAVSEATPESAASYDRLQSQNSTEKQPVKFSISDVDLKKSLQTSFSNSNRLLYPSEAQNLVSYLCTKDDALLCRTLTTIANAAAFTVNQNYLRDAGCLPILVELLQRNNSLVQAACGNAIANMSVNDKNQLLLKEALPVLFDLVSEEETSHSVLLVSLRCLTNLSVTDQWHGSYVHGLESLFGFLDSDLHDVKLQTMKLLVNLSCNVDMVHHLLAQMAPKNFDTFLLPDADTDFLIRFLCFLGNLTDMLSISRVSSAKDLNDLMSVTGNTLYNRLYGMETAPQLFKQLYILSKNENIEVSDQANKVYNSLLP